MATKGMQVVLLLLLQSSSAWVVTPALARAGRGTSSSRGTGTMRHVGVRSRSHSQRGVRQGRCRGSFAREMRAKKDDDDEGLGKPSSTDRYNSTKDFLIAPVHQYNCTRSQYFSRHCTGKHVLGFQCSCVHVQLSSTALLLLCATDSRTQMLCTCQRSYQRMLPVSVCDVAIESSPHQSSTSTKNSALQ